ELVADVLVPRAVRLLVRGEPAVAVLDRAPQLGSDRLAPVAVAPLDAGFLGAGGRGEGEYGRRSDRGDTGGRGARARGRGTMLDTVPSRSSWAHRSGVPRLPRMVMPSVVSRATAAPSGVTRLTCMPGRRMRCSRPESRSKRCSELSSDPSEFTVISTKS